MQKKTIYLDNAATTPVYPEVVGLMTQILSEEYGNPSSMYHIGQRAGKIIDEARNSIAKTINCQSKELYFTSCGSEAINWGIKGAAKYYSRRGKHIVTTKIEHHAMLNTMKSLEKEGFEVTYLGVGSDGIIDLGELEKAVRDDTILVSIMYANNEIGTIQPVKEAAGIAKAHGAKFFTDAVQAVGHLDIDFAELGVDMLAFSGHKFGAPKGVGALCVKTGTIVQNLIDGGGQERGKRGGTENTSGIAAMAKALEISAAKIKDNDKVAALRDYCLDEILKRIPNAILNGSREKRLPSNLNVAFEFIEGESMLLLLDMNGICASSGSACSSRSLDVSHVLLAVGLPHEIAHGSLRISLSHETTKEEIDYLLEQLVPVVQRLRDMSPLYQAEK